MQRYDEIQKGLFFYETPCKYNYKKNVNLKSASVCVLILRAHEC